MKKCQIYLVNPNLVHFCPLCPQNCAKLTFHNNLPLLQKKILPTPVTCPNNWIKWIDSDIHIVLKNWRYLFLLTLILNIPSKCSIGKYWSFCEWLALGPKSVFWYKIKGKAEHNYFLWKEIFQVLFFVFLNFLGIFQFISLKNTFNSTSTFRDSKQSKTECGHCKVKQVINLMIG